MKKSRLQKLILLFFALPVLAMLVYQGGFVWDYLNNRRMKCDYALPDGFQGWVTIKYGRPECPKLQIVNERLYHPIGADGTLCTSTTVSDGYGVDRYYYQSKPEENLWIPPAFEKSSRSVPVAKSIIWAHETRVLNPDDKSRIDYWFYVGKKPDEAMIIEQRHKMSL